MELLSPAGILCVLSLLECCLASGSHTVPDKNLDILLSCLAHKCWLLWGCHPCPSLPYVWEAEALGT